MLGKDCRKLFPHRKKPRTCIYWVRTGLRHIDAVSFVSPKHVQQMADSEAVLDHSSFAAQMEP